MAHDTTLGGTFDEATANRLAERLVKVTRRLIVGVGGKGHEWHLLVYEERSLAPVVTILTPADWVAFCTAIRQPALAREVVDVNTEGQA